MAQEVDVAMVQQAEPPRLTGLDALLDAAEALAAGGERVILGIAGAPAAGKSTLAEALVAGLNVRHEPGWAAHVPMDGFHLADVQLERLGLRAAKGKPETFDPYGYAALLARLRAETDHPVYAPGFERDLEQPLAGAVVVPASARFVVSEGNYLLLDEPAWRVARDRADAVWFVDVDDDLRTRRLVQRHQQFGKTGAEAVDWVANVDEPNAELVRASRDAADLVILNGASGWSIAA